MYSILGNDVTSDLQLNSVGRKIFKNSWLGVHPVNVKKATLMNRIKPGLNYGIINVDHSSLPGSHWLSIIYNGKTWYIYDSYARKLKKLIPRFIRSIDFRYINMNKQADQKDNENSCGARSMAVLLYTCKYGIQSASGI